MNNIQKSFKQKAKCGLRAFAGGGLLDSFNKRQQELDTAVGNGGGYNALPDTPSVAQAMAEGAANSGIPQPTAQSTLDGIISNSNLSGRQKARAAMALNTNGALDTSGIRGLSANQNAALTVDQFNADAGVKRRGLRNDMLAFADGGTVDPVEQMLANMKNKYGVGNQSQPAPAPQPVQQAPAPAPQPARPVQQAPTIQGAVQAIRSRQEMLRNFANGGEIEPFVDGAGFIHGTPGVDKVPAQVAQTGENILVGDGERIVNKAQNKALEALAQKTTGQPLDDYLEGATGQPVGPKLKKGIRAAANGAEVDDLTSRRPVPEAARPAPVAGYNSSPEAAALRERLAAPEGGNAIRNQIAEVRNTGPHPAPAATAPAAPVRPAPIAPEMLAPEPAAPARSGLRGMADKVTNAIGKGVDAARNVVAPAAAETRPGMGTPGEGALKGYEPKPSGYSGTGIGGVKGAVKDLGRYVVPAAKMAGRGLALASAAHQGWDTGGDLRELWSNDEADLPTKIAGSLEGAGNVAGNILTLGMVHNPVTSLVGTFTGNDTALTRGLRTTGRTLDKDVLDGKAKAAKAGAATKPTAVDPRTEAQVAAAQLANDPNIRSLRSAGVQGDVGGDDPRLTAKEDLSKGPQLRGIRTIDTPNGKVYAGRDGNGQLNVVSNLGQTAAESEAARAKEAARMTAGLKRQTETFDKLALERDMKSNNPADRASAAQRMGLRQLDAQIAQANQQNETTRRGQDLVLQAHQTDNQTKLATLKNQQAQQNFENYSKTLDQLFGADNPKEDPQGSARRREFVNDIADFAQGDLGVHPSQLNPRVLSNYKTLWNQFKEEEPSATGKAFRKWVLNHPWVKDPNMFRQMLAQDEPNGLGFSSNANGSPISMSGAVGNKFLTGDANRQIIEMQRNSIYNQGK